MRSPRGTRIVALLAILCLAACGDDDGDNKNNQGADPCKGITCGNDGRCVAVGAAPTCSCPTGFTANGLACVAAPSAPTLSNLPATESGAVGATDSFMLMASDPAAGALTFAVNDSACAFDVNVDAAGQLTWTCPAASASCDVIVTATSSSGLSDSDTLSIACINGLPAFTSTPPTAATEGEELRYDITCQDPDNLPITLSVAPDDTCGGALDGDTYVFTPSEAQGGASCLLRVLCADAESQEAQFSMIAVAEANQPPALTNLPASVTAVRGAMGSFMTTAADADLPAQPLTFSATTTCSFPVTVDANSGAVSFTCGADVEACDASISVTDGAANAQATLSIACANTPPTVASVAVSPAMTKPTAPLSCAYTFADADGDADMSTVEWLVNNTVVGMGATLSAGYAGGDEVTCRVTPHDGIDQGTPVTSPPVTIPDTASVDAGASHTCAIQRGALYCWGYNTSSQLGDGTTTSRNAPVEVLASDVTAVSASAGNSCAIQAGALKCWGDNSAGQIGDGSSTNRNTPTQVTGLTTGVTAVAAGAGYTCAIQAGALKCWGANFSGQLGDGTTTNRSTPTQVTGLTSGVTAVAVYETHTCAIQAGALKCWGGNFFGQLGDGTTTNRSTPTQVTGLTSGVTAVDEGIIHTCAIHNGALKCWGHNFEGKLGDGTTTNRSTPTQVATMDADVTTISVGDGHTCAAQRGALKCWGFNGSSQLGDGTTTNRSTPTQVTGLTSGVTAIATGVYHTCVIQSGALYCVGRNAEGQLGDGTNTARTAPTSISGL